MNSRKLKRDLPRDWRVKSDRSQIHVTAGNSGQEFHVERNSGWHEPELAQFLKSKVPVATIHP